MSTHKGAPALGEGLEEEPQIHRMEGARIVWAGYFSIEVGSERAPGPVSANNGWLSARRSGVNSGLFHRFRKAEVEADQSELEAASEQPLPGFAALLWSYHKH